VLKGLLSFVLILLVPAAAPAQLQINEQGVTIGFAHFDAKKGVPVGWRLDRKAGQAALRLEKEAEGFCLNMVSNEQSSFGVERPLKVNIKDYPFLTWTWKVSKLPSGGDVRKAEVDDQAAQLYIAFTATGFPAKLNTPVLGYIWDNEAPKEWTGRSPQLGGGKMRYVVVRNKTDTLGEWHRERRNIYQDYRKLFRDLRGGEPPGPTLGISVYINSQHTRSSAECSIGSVFFSRQ